MHTAAILEEAADAMARLGGEAGALAAGTPPALIFCGDLNSDLDDGVPGDEEGEAVAAAAHVLSPLC